MTAVKVVDASALAALLFGEPDAGAVSDRLADARLVAPGLIGVELANVCVVKCRRQPQERQTILGAFRLRAQLNVEEISIDHDAVAALALETDLTAYDASYLWLAKQLGVELVTLDKQLARAAAQA